MSYPSTIDSFASPGAKLSTNPHSSLHNAETTALTALETKVGVDSSAVSTSIDYLLKSTSSVNPGHKHTISNITDAGAFIVTGLILPYAGSSAPTGFLLCDGSAVSRTTYATLFALVSTTYGTGDGSTTFNVPDMRSRSIIGTGTGSKVLTFSSRSSNVITVTGSANSSTNEVQTGQAVVYVSTGGVITGLTSTTTYYVIRVAYNQFNLATSLANAIAGTPISLSSDGSGTQTFTYTLSARALGDTGGEETHGLVLGELSAHTHGGVWHDPGSGSSVGSTGSKNYDNTNVTNSAGGSGAHNNMSPYLSLSYVIKT